MYNTKLVNDLNKRKVFKKHVCHNDNVEGFTWDNYDTMFYYTSENEDVWFLPKPKRRQSMSNFVINIYVMFAKTSIKNTNDMEHIQKL